MNKELFHFWVRREYPHSTELIDTCLGIAVRVDISHHIRKADEISKDMLRSENEELNYSWELDEFASIMQTLSEDIYNLECLVCDLLKDKFKSLDEEEINHLKKEFLKEKLKEDK